MNIVTHDWNGSAITQLSEATKIAAYDVPAGYVNATQMCKACKKLWADYARLESTKQYWEGLSLSMGIPIDLLVMSILRCKNDQRGTWVHPEIAIDLAQWVSVEFRIWANRTLRGVIEKQIAPDTLTLTPEVPIPQPLLPTPQEISDIYDLTLGKAGLDPKLVAGVKLNAIAKRYPVLQPEAELAKTLLQVKVESELLSPSQLGEMLTESTGEKWSAQRVNKLLVDQDFQFRNPDGDNPAYLPTTKGKEYGQIVLNTAKGRDKTIQSLRWFPGVLNAVTL
ncbi:KilA-N domain-containing protein [Pelatocladus sp. BLCC-F211]|uniref:KilA-N domain-containing protein n=1 Tax=Pelatocladus sp. BLCC-F211 TaxID=3342752 RepID=UPI0035B6BC15